MITLFIWLRTTLNLSAGRRLWVVRREDRLGHSSVVSLASWKKQGNSYPTSLGCISFLAFIKNISIQLSFMVFSLLNGWEDCLTCFHCKCYNITRNRVSVHSSDCSVTKSACIASMFKSEKVCLRSPFRWALPFVCYNQWLWKVNWKSLLVFATIDFWWDWIYPSRNKKICFSDALALMLESKCVQIAPKRNKNNNKNKLYEIKIKHFNSGFKLGQHFVYSRQLGSLSDVHTYITYTCAYIYTVFPLHYFVLSPCMNITC